ncbi:sulfite exporter TauE/SafE family protein [Flavobacterium branchiophilum]|uniref:Urease accessory protein UreH-like transmembrane domain-containing protein n=1 Tax=Flavobacterium branchiophilum TaxID=55197 RepID=A0A2H3KBF8_9FLAO|nr:sulfite exporter TauE/SafE family protein [Flavobacterium branchiophilum]PDS24340.1 hypothetical protein B0A77_08415 [Flavobacterium branchiophilum]
MFFTAFIFGLLSSLHCIGMCGPIALMLPVDRHNEAKRVLQILTYQTGRLTAYSLMGLLFGLLGKGLYLAGLQQRLSIFIGIAMILFFLIPEKKINAIPFLKFFFIFISKIKSKLGQQFKQKTYKSLLSIGFLNGFLPCGMVYSALFGAIAQQNVVHGMLFMCCFGLGTIPLMSGVVLFQNWITLSVRNKIQKIIPIIGICIGFVFILRGLGMNIPYISPSNMQLFIQENANCH